MKAIILAAGLGTRLRPITNDVPKCMVPVNGIRIIDKQIVNLLNNKVEDILVIAGYKADILKEHLKNEYPRVKVLVNDQYDSTNNMFSLFLAQEYIKDSDFLLMNGDVYFDSNIITEMLMDMDHSCIAVDNRCFFDESMKITMFGNKVVSISKKIKEENAAGVSIDVYKFLKETGQELFSEIEAIIIDQNDVNSWTEVAIDRIFKKTTIKPLIISNNWMEIDNYEDLHKAEILFSKDVL